MKTTTKAIKKAFTISRILMLVGALWIIIYGILTASNVINNNFYGWNTSWQGLVLIGLIYILLPFSTKPGWWSRIWGIFLAIISLIVVIGSFVGKNVDFQSAWTYLNTLPHLLIAIGSIFWIIQG